MIFLVFLFGLICLAIELQLTVYLWVQQWHVTAILLFLFGVQTTMSAVWRSLHLNAGMKYQHLSEDPDDAA